MAEYYPLLAKAVGSLPNSTPDTRRVVYERARKALIGQLRTLHPPVPDEDIEHESLELDRAISRIEAELAELPSEPAAPRLPVDSKPPSTVPAPFTKAATPKLLVSGAPAEKPASVFADKPFQPLRTKLPTPKSPGGEGVDPKMADIKPVEAKPVEGQPSLGGPTPRSSDAPPSFAVPGVEGNTRPPRVDGQRPIAPQPPVAKGPKRRLWIIPVGVGIVAAFVAVIAWKLRDRPETLVRAKPAETQTQSDTSKIVERVGGSDRAASGRATTDSVPAPDAVAPDAKPVVQSSTVTPPNPELPVAHRAALLVEAPNDDNKVKTYLGTVVWKLNTVNEGQADAASLAVEANIDLPDDKTKAIVTFQKNTDPSLPASHTIKVRFMVQPGSATGDIKQINVPQMRREDNPSGEALAGVTVPVIQNSFLVGLSPGNAETANLELIRALQWIDIPILLDSGKIAKLTFEKSDSGQRDLSEAIAAWQK